jgi:hypothetical protein
MHGTCRQNGYTVLLFEWMNKWSNSTQQQACMAHVGKMRKKGNTLSSLSRSTFNMILFQMTSLVDL